jgi:hypothetical protein
MHLKIQDMQQVHIAQRHTHVRHNERVAADIAAPALPLPNPVPNPND